MDEAKLRQIIDEARFTGASGEEKTMDMMRIYERKLRKGGKGGIPSLMILSNHWIPTNCG